LAQIAGEARWPVGAATRGARRRTPRYVEHPEASRHRWAPCIVGRSRQLVRSVGSVTHQGERPMSITWRLRHAMPAELFEEMKVAAG